MKFLIVYFKKQRPEEKSQQSINCFSIDDSSIKPPELMSIEKDFSSPENRENMLKVFIYNSYFFKIKISFHLLNTFILNDFN